MGFCWVACRPPVSVSMREGRCEPLAAKHAEAEKGMAAIVTHCFINTNDSYLKCCLSNVHFSYLLMLHFLCLLFSTFLYACFSCVSCE